MSGIIGRKAGMTRVFQEDGQVIPVTLISCPPAKITQVKTQERDGYPAVVLGFEPLKKPRKTKKFRVMREFRVQDPTQYQVDNELTLEQLKDVPTVSIVGYSKGQGFAGTIKRHHFHSGPSSHGSHAHREPGSVGARAKPGRIHKGKRMAGNMGNERVTLQDIPVIQVDVEKNLLAVKGPVPGPTGGILVIKTAS